MAGAEDEVKIKMREHGLLDVCVSHPNCISTCAAFVTRVRSRARV